METILTFSQFVNNNNVPGIFNTNVVLNNPKYRTYTQFSLIDYAKNIDNTNNICIDIETNCYDDDNDEYYINLYECLKIAKNKHNIYPIYPIIMQIKKDISDTEIKCCDFVVLNNGVIFSNTFLKLRDESANIFAIKNVYVNNDDLYICNFSHDVDDNIINKKMYVKYAHNTPMLSTMAIDKIRSILSNEFTNDSLNKIKICIQQDRIMMDNPINYYDVDISNKNTMLSSQNKSLFEEAAKLKNNIFALNLKIKNTNISLQNNSLLEETTKFKNEILCLKSKKRKLEDNQKKIKEILLKN